MVAEIFDLYYLFVENLFGNLLFAILGIGIILGIIAMIARMSFLLVSYILVMFFVIMLVGTFGSFVGVIVFSFTAIYFFMSVIPWIRGWIG